MYCIESSARRDDDTVTSLIGEEFEEEPKYNKKKH